MPTWIATVTKRSERLEMRSRHLDAYYLLVAFASSRSSMARSYGNPLGILR